MGSSTGFAIGSLSVIELTGADRNKILNNLCTQDLKTLQPGQVRETFVLDVKGRTISHGLIACFESKTLFISTPDQAQKLLPHIERYIIREDAVVADASTKFQAYLIHSDHPLTQNVFQNFLGANDCAEQLSSDSGALCIKAPWIGKNSLLILSPLRDHAPAVAIHANSESALSQLIENCQPSDCQNRSGWELLRIENHWPWYGVDIDEKNLPQEIGIDARAISFKKGCYLGQETVARLDALGQVQKQLVQVLIQPQNPWEFQLPCELFIEEKSIGFLTSAAIDQHRPGHPPIWRAMAMLRRGYFDSKQPWNLNGNLQLQVCNA